MAAKKPSKRTRVRLSWWSTWPANAGSRRSTRGLQGLYEQYQGQGLEILGFPANDFMGQEPGTDDEIGEFCEINYGVTFPLFSKITVKGEEMHPLYQELTTMPEPIGGDVLWNFQKYLLNRDGEVVAKFGPKTEPQDPELVAQVESLLA